MEGGARRIGEARAAPLEAHLWRRRRFVVIVDALGSERTPCRPHPRNGRKPTSVAERSAQPVTLHHGGVQNRGDADCVRIDLAVKR